MPRRTHNRLNTRRFPFKLSRRHFRRGKVKKEKKRKKRDTSLWSSVNRDGGVCHTFKRKAAKITGKCIHSYKSALICLWQLSFTCAAGQRHTICEKLGKIATVIVLRLAKTKPKRGARIRRPRHAGGGGQTTVSCVARGKSIKPHSLSARLKRSQFNLIRRDRVKCTLIQQASILNCLSLPP